MGWTVGKVKITRIVEIESTGGSRFIPPQAGNEQIRALPWLIPDFATPEGRLKMTVHTLVLETPTRRIAVDTCIGNDKSGRSVPTWNNQQRAFLDDMAAAGYPPDSIDTVLCTHLHVDHVGWNTRLVDGAWVPTFPNARYLFGRTEYEHWKADRSNAEQAAVFDDSIKPVVDAGLADLVDSSQVLTDEISLIPTPGHSPGHVSVLIRSEGEEALLTGDVAHHPCQMAHPEWSSTADSDPVRSAATRRELFGRFADTPTLVIGAHYGAGRLRRDGEGFRLVV